MLNPVPKIAVALDHILRGFNFVGGESAGRGVQPSKLVSRGGTESVGWRASLVWKCETTGLFWRLGKSWKWSLTDVRKWISLGHCGVIWGEAKMLLTGTYLRALDEKRRVSLPKPIRHWAIGNSAEKLQVYLTPGTEQCLQLHTASSMELQLGELRRQSPGREAVRVFSRIYYAQAEICEIDSQGRISVPTRLVEWAKLEREVVWIGVGTHVEMWCQHRWAEYLEQRRQGFDSVVELAFGHAAGHTFEAENQAAVGATSIRPK